MDADVIIVGGGLNGPTLALALAVEGLSSVVVDALPEAARGAAEFDGRAYALAVASRRLLGAIGVWERVAADAQPIREIKVTDGRAGEGPGPFWMHFGEGEIAEGPMGHMVEDRHLRPALLAAMDEAPLIATLSGETVVAQDIAPDGVTVRLASGKALSGRLVVGADGRGSGVARRAGIGRMQWGYGQSALVCAVTHERDHGGIAHQFFMPSGPLAILPLTGRRSSIVWSEEAGRAARLEAASDAEFLEALRPAFGSFLGEIALAGRRWSYPLGLSLAESLVAERVALVGDAGHGVHPLAGQGLNAGFRDVAALADVLGAARRRGEDPGTADVLERYARWRRFDTAALAFATDGFNRLFSNDNPLLRAVRDAGLGLVGAVPWLRRAAVREAAGLSGDLPRLMRQGG